MQAMKAYGFGGAALLNLRLPNRGEWSLLHRGRFTSRYRTMYTHLIWDYVGTRAGVDVSDMWEILPLPEIKKRFIGHASYIELSHYIDHNILAQLQSQLEKWISVKSDGTVSTLTRFLPGLPKDQIRSPARIGLFYSMSTPTLGFYPIRTEDMGVGAW
jgi:hypothetical protein